tara:strand:- start:2948 stop:4111 length:1164 start_codon:yes stop_codon:yes gene_type:complete
MAEKVPDEFKKVMKDFYKDILTSFPEYKEKLGENEINFLTETNNDNAYKLFTYCQNIYPERFFDILYQNVEIFDNNEIDTNFLPNIEFKDIWKEEISEKTKEVIWKYLQLVLFSVTSNMDDSESFGDTAKLFEAINEDELKKKLEETMEQMNGMFNDISGSDFQMPEGFADMSGVNMDDVPDPEKMQEHINGLLGGKLGRLAHEIAEETANDLDVNMDDAADVTDVFQKLFKNPGKLMSMVKKVGSKLDSKIKSGEIKESELMQEASELMEKMKNMPGMKNMDKILEKMGLPTGGKNTKMNMNAFQSHMKSNIGKAKQKERMLRKLEERRNKLISQKSNQNTVNTPNNKYSTMTWGDNINVEKTNRNEKINKKNKKKKRKKKNKNKN